MKKQAATKTFRSMKVDNAVMKMGIGAVLFMNALLVFNIATRDEAVILVPPYQNETIEFINGRANQEFYSQWAWSVAMLTGNISPGNAKFVRGELERISTPQLYRKLMDTIDTELEGIVRDNAVITFSPREITYDPEINRFFVTGLQQTGGPGVKVPVQKQITYEMGFSTERLRVYLASYSVYEGRPMTAAIRQQELLKREKAEESEKKQ